MSKLGIKDVAERAGVSSATVSRTLRNPDLVSEKTRKKVMAAVDAAAYKPNRFGASLRTQKSGNILVVMPDITNQVNAGIIKAIEKEALRSGYSVLLGDTQNDPKREHYYADLVSSGQADGILLFTHRLPFKVDHQSSLQQQLPPLVNACELITNDELVSVSINNELGAKTAVNHLISLGHTKIAALMGPIDTPSALARYKGYKAALDIAHIEKNENYVIKGSYQADSGIEAMEKLLKLKDKPTAVFCFSDDIAIGAMSALREKGYEVPQDISVIGFDDITYAALIHPKLSTIRQPTEAIGSLCTQLLIKQLNGIPLEKNKYELPFELIVRQSTSALKQA